MVLQGLVFQFTSELNLSDHPMSSQIPKAKTICCISKPESFFSCVFQALRILAMHEAQTNTPLHFVQYFYE